MKPIRILFLCTGNSCRSQMAEGWARRLKSEFVEAYSAGIRPGELDPMAVKVMGEAGVDISSQYSKHVDDLADEEFDYVVTLCGNVRESCPVFPGGVGVMHVGFDDPRGLAAGVETEEEALDCYRRVRDQIRVMVEGIPEVLKAASGE